MKQTAFVLFFIINYSTSFHAQVNFNYGHLKFSVDPNIKYINGSVTYCFNSISNTDTLILNFANNLIIDSIIYHQQNISNYYYTPSDYFNIVLPQNSNGLDSINIVYHGVPSTTGLGSFNQSMHNNNPIISTLSQPYGSSTWMPSINNLKDKIDSVKIEITCPSQYKAIANGLLVNTATIGTYSTFVYKHKYPIATYLLAFAVTNYTENSTIYNGNGYSMAIKNFTYPEDDANWMNGAQSLPNILHLFDSIFGDYPFKNEQYGMAQVNFGGGMEHQTITFMGSYNHEISAHELAHHWFGNKVTCASWHDLWLNEGFATYLSGIAYQYSGTGFYWKPFLTGRMQSAMGELGGSVYIADTTNINRMFDGRLTYNKAAMVLHQLRYIIGDSAFFSACRNYLNDVNLAYKFATPADLKQHFELASGTDLTYYFNQWIYGEGYPIYNIVTNNLGNNSYGISISYNTSTNVTTSFTLPVPIKFIGNNLDTTIVFNYENQNENFNVNLNFTPTHFICDPELNIIAKSNASVGLVSINNPKKSFVFPTVATDIFNVSCDNSFTTYEVYTTDGKLVLSNIIQGGILNKINLSHLPKAFYFLQLNGNFGVETFKIIKE